MLANLSLQLVGILIIVGMHVLDCVYLHLHHVSEHRSDAIKSVLLAIGMGNCYVGIGFVEVPELCVGYQEPLVVV